MASRLRTLKTLGVAAVYMTVPLVGTKIYAEGNSIDSQVVKISELPLYERPQDKYTYKFVPREPTTFEKNISNIRLILSSYTGFIKSSSISVIEKFGVAKVHTLDFVEYIQNDPGVLPRAAVITVMGLGGIVAGYRGGYTRKIVYSGLGMMTAAALCYPNQAVDITTNAYEQVISHAQELWGGAKSENKEIEKDASKVDHGQSKQEDKDMYTTRS